MSDRRKPSTSSEEIRAFVEASRGDLKRHLTDLIRARTANPPGDECRAAEVLKAFCEAESIPYTTHEKVPGRTNLVARIGQGGPRVLVPIHFDTVPAGDGWETDPFDLVDRDGRLIGRGVKDNKGPMAAMMVAAQWLKAHEADLKGTLLFVGAADEEAGSTLGMAYLLDVCGLEAEMAIVPDAGSLMREIDVGEKGALFLKVTAVGRQAHGSRPEAGVSAVWPVVDFLNRIRTWRPAAEPSDLFTPPTLNVGAVHGGTVANMVPGRCEALVDIRFLPGTDGEVVLGQVRKTVAEIEAASPGVRMGVEVLSLQAATLVASDHPMTEVLERRIEAVTGRRPARQGQSGATVAKFLILKGIPAIGFACGPEGVEHQAGEWITMNDLTQFAEVMIGVVTDLLSGEEGLSR